MQALRAGSPFPAVLWVSWTYSPVVSKAMCFGAPSLQLCDLDVGTNPLLHRKSSIVFTSLANMGCCTWVHILARLSLPLLSQCTPFTLCYGAAILLAFRSFSEEIIPHAGTAFFVQKKQVQALLRLLP